MITNKLNKAGSGGIGAALPAAVLLLAAALPAFAVPQVMSPYGDQTAWRGAEINAMAGTGVALYRGGMSAVFNPALLTCAQDRRLDVSMSLDQEHEDRFLPLFDGFDNYVTDAAIASNRYHYFQTGASFAGKVLAGGTPIHFGLALTDRYPYQYTFDEEIRNPDFGAGDWDTDAILEERRLETSGTLRTLSLGLGFAVHPRVSAGAAVHYAFGNRNTVRTVGDHFEDDNSYRHEDDRDLQGVNFSLGLKGTVSPRLDVGASWESSLTASGDLTSYRYDVEPDGSFTAVTTVLEDSEIKYPNIFRVGMAFRPRTEPRTVFTMELEYIPWDELEDTMLPAGDNQAGLDNTTDVRIGLQHTFYNDTAVRFGFRHLNTYTDEDASVSFFSAGVGTPLGSGMISASLELGKVTSIQEHNFPYDPDMFGDAYGGDEYLTPDPESRVEDTRFRVGVGYAVEF